jgi:hypothetical protein
MTPEQILRYDVEHNQDEDVELKHILWLIKHERTYENASVIREGNTLIIFKTVGKDSCEFHVFNADTPNKLAINVLTFLKLVKKLGYSKAFTLYKKPGITQLFEKFGRGRYKFDISKVDEKFKAEVYL